MRLPYSDDEICAIYRMAKDKRAQIEILADMNLTCEEAIRDLLREYGYKVESRKPRKPRAPVVSEKKKKELDDIYDKYKAAADKGLNANEAAKEIGVKPNQVRNYAKKHGLSFAPMPRGRGAW